MAYTDSMACRKSASNPKTTANKTFFNSLLACDTKKKEENVIEKDPIDFQHLVWSNSAQALKCELASFLTN